MTHASPSPTQHTLLSDDKPPDAHTARQRLVYTDAGAWVDHAGRASYRYALWRTWDATKPRVLWVMLNPSTADGESDDPTIRRVVTFAHDWGYGSISVVNLYALRATYPSDLRALAECSVDPVGSQNDAMIHAHARRAVLIVCAWGCHPAVQTRMRAVYDDVRDLGTPHCLGVTKEGYPRHPLYVPKTARPVEYRMEVAS